MTKSLDMEFERLIIFCKGRCRYDCSEVVEDLKRVDAGGHVKKITAKNKTHQIYILEYGTMTLYYEHEIYIKDGWVYDPRYDSNPTDLNEYMSKIYELNGGKSNVEETEI